jgi:hypothetical protein
VHHELRWQTEQFLPDQSSPDYKLRFWLNSAELYSYLPLELDPGQPDIARFQQTGP